MHNNKILSASIALSLISSSALADNFFVGASAGMQKDKTREIEVSISSVEKKQDLIGNGGVFSLNLGYATIDNKTHFITELGAEIGTAKMTDKLSPKPHYVKKTHTFTLAQKIGYEFFANNVTYVNLGINYNFIKVRYDKKESYKNKKSGYILGLGHQYSINDNVKVFGELNYSALLGSSLRELSSMQAKIGARYYF